MGVRTLNRAMANYRLTKAELAALPPAQELARHVLNECVCMQGGKCHRRAVELARQVKEAEDDHQA